MADINRGSSNTVDSGNSSIATLSNGAVFTGTWKEVLEFALITIQVIASHASATDGLEIQWSSDASNIDDTDKYTVPAATGKVFTFGPQVRYFRIKYTNGATTQTYFRLQTILKLAGQKASSHRISDDISAQDDAELVKAVLSGENAVGNFTNLRTDSAGRLLISSDVATPVDTTAVTQTAVSSINSDTDTIYTITNGKTLTIQLFEAGCEANATGGSKVALYEDPNGNLSVLNPISIIYINGASNQNSVSTEFVGNGTRRIVMRRSIFSGGSREIYGRWRGYEQ